MFKDDELHETRYCEGCLELQQKLLEAMDNYAKSDLSRVKEYKELVDKYKAKEQECDKLKFNLKGTGILGLMKRNVQLRKALDEIEKLMPKFEDSTECAYGDFDCENCSSLDEDTVCTYKLKKIILDIINKAKEK